MRQKNPRLRRRITEDEVLDMITRRKARQTIAEIARAHDTRHPTAVHWLRQFGLDGRLIDSDAMDRLRAAARGEPEGLRTG